MNEDMRHAFAALQAAAVQLAHVSALPSAFGSRVRWPNGLVWTRVGENEWLPEGDSIPIDLAEARAGAWTAPSRHIATDGAWTPEP